MHVLHEPDDPHIGETIRYIAITAIEGNQTNLRMITGTVTLNVSANTLQTASVTFYDAQGKNVRPFRKGVTPSILVSISSLSNTASQVTASSSTPTNTGFTAQVYSSVAQTVTLSYLAIGQA